MTQHLGGILVLAVLLALAALWLWAAFDLLGSPHFGRRQRIAWALMLFLLPPVGLILYLAFSGYQKHRNSSDHLKNHDPGMRVFLHSKLDGGAATPEQRRRRKKNRRSF